MPWPRRSKYGATKAHYNGKTYHSQLERDDAIWLHTLEREGEITDLKEQVRYRIVVNGHEICSSIVDFQFRHKGILVWFESKGFYTPEYKLKAKLIEATIPDGEVYIVNVPDLQKYLRGRLT